MLRDFSSSQVQLAEVSSPTSLLEDTFRPFPLYKKKFTLRKTKELCPLPQIEWQTWGWNLDLCVLYPTRWLSVDSAGHCIMIGKLKPLLFLFIQNFLPLLSTHPRKTALKFWLYYCLTFETMVSDFAKVAGEPNLDLNSLWLLASDPELQVWVETAPPTTHSA